MRNYWKYVGITSLHILAVYMVLAVLAPYFSSLGYSEQWISFVFSIFPFTMFATSIFSGELADKFGRNWLIRIALFTTALSYMLYFAGSPFSIITGRLLDGASFAALTILLLAKVQDMLSDEDRGRYTGIYFSITSVARILGPLIGGYLADRWISSPFITASVILILTIFTLKGAKFHKKKDKRIHPIKDLKWFLRDEQLKPMVILGPITNGLVPAIHVFLPLLVVNELGLNYVAAGAAASAYMVGHLIQFAAGELADHIGATRVILTGSAVMAISIFSIPFISTYIGLLFISFLCGVGASSWNTTCYQWLSAKGEKEDKEGTTVGAYISISKLGEGISYLISGAVIAAFGYAGLFHVLGGIGIVGVVIASFSLLKLKKKGMLLA